jgi:hypothetical protein
MPKTPVVPLTNLRIRVRSRGGKPVQGATVSLDSPAMSKDTDANGFVQFGLSEDQIKALSPPNQVVVRAKKRHHGADPGPGKAIVPGEIKLTASVSKSGFDPATPGLNKDKKGPFLDLVLMDAGLNFGAATPAVVTRRLTDDQVQKELMFIHLNGDVTLAKASEFEFDHDPASGEFAACDPTKCKLKAPAANRRVGVQKALVGGVKFLSLVSFTPSAAKKTDQIPGQRFLREKFGWNDMSMALLDQRHVVGLTRMCKQLRSKHGINAIFTQGVSGDTTRADAHGHGLALDFGGCGKTLPDSKDKNPTVRLGTDFIVFLHWGNAIPMWDGKTVKANPTNSATWKRLTVNDDGFDYTADPTAKVARLHYRLDPAPHQEPVPPGLATSDPVLAAQLAGVAPHFVTSRVLFQDVYEFATREYSDDNSTLGPRPAGAGAEVQTPIDSHDGNFVLHPDYPKPNLAGAKNGRQAHVNHHHFQLGPTKYPSGARTT